MHCYFLFTQRTEVYCFRNVVVSPFFNHQLMTLLSTNNWRLHMNILITNCPKICVHYLLRVMKCMQLTWASLASARNNTLVISNIKANYSGRKSINFQCPSLWNHFSSKKIQLTTDSCLNLNKVNSISHFKSLLKKHFKFTYSIQ